LDKYVTELLGSDTNRCFGSRRFPQVNFTRGYSTLTLLGSEERVGQLLTLSLVLHTDRGQEILGGRFSPGFDIRRKEWASRFLGKRKHPDEDHNQDDESKDGIVGDIPSDNDYMPVAIQAPVVGELPTATKRKVDFVPTRKNIQYVYQQIQSHDLGFLLNDIFPEGHIFAVEERPGLHQRYPTEAHKRNMVVSGMRKEWPHVFMNTTQE
jgi:hypothetical protein